MRERLLEIFAYSATQEELLKNLEEFVQDQIWHATVGDE